MSEPCPVLTVIHETLDLNWLPAESALLVPWTDALRQAPTSQTLAQKRADYMIQQAVKVFVPAALEACGLPALGTELRHSENDFALNIAENTKTAIHAHYEHWPSDARLITACTVCTYLTYALGRGKSFADQPDKALVFRAATATYAATSSADALSRESLEKRHPLVQATLSAYKHCLDLTTP